MLNILFWAFHKRQRKIFVDSLGILLAWRFFIYVKKFFYIREKKAALAYKSFARLAFTCGICPYRQSPTNLTRQKTFVLAA